MGDEMDVDQEDQIYFMTEFFRTISCVPTISIQAVVFELLYRDFWSSDPGPPLNATFAEMGMSSLDLHLLQFELQMIFGIDITGDAGVQLTDSVAHLLKLIEHRRAGFPA